MYVRSGRGWVLQQKPTASDGDTNEHLGSAVALRGDVIVAGAPGADNNRGAVYVFRRAGSAWTQQAKVTAPGGGDPTSSFGAASRCRPDARGQHTRRPANGLGDAARSTCSRAAARAGASRRG